MIADQDARNCFAEKLDQNYSVIAPAGVGKTTAIVQRIVNMAKYRPELLRNLAVVTYTRKAAAEMYQRVREKIRLEGEVSQEAVRNLREVSFGTIHSFCLNLLREFGRVVGLPFDCQIETDNLSLWNDYAGSQTLVSEEFLDRFSEGVLKFFSLRSVLFEGFEKIYLDGDQMEFKQISSPDIRSLLGYAEKKSKTVLNHQDQLRAWAEQLDESNFTPAPIYNGSAKEYLSLFKDAFNPFWENLGREVLALNQEVARNFFKYRIEQGRIFYDDVIFLMLKLLREDASRGALLDKKFSIILDEAQDTDEDQFEILLKLSSAEGLMDKPGVGRFSMVGDPQQSIFSSRADLPSYLRIHDQLIKEGRATSLTLNTTFRCAKGVVSQLNDWFPKVLKEHKDQVQYVPLVAGREKSSGQVMRLPIPLKDDAGKSDELQSKYEAEIIGDWLVSNPPEALGVDDWSSVAILCPRNQWLEVFVTVLRERELPVQAYVSQKKNSDSPLYLWLLGVLKVMKNPFDSFEILGVLREVFGERDDEIFYYINQHFEPKLRHPLNIAVRHLGEGSVVQSLNRLYDLRQSIVGESPDVILRVVENRLKLKERIESLGLAEPSQLFPVFDEFMHSAFEASQQGVSFSRWLDEREKALENACLEESVKKGHIQLMTCHKAKGLEWDVVLLPLFFRSLSKPSSKYPRLLTPKGNPLLEAKVKLNKHHDVGNYEEILYAQDCRELERLLYVSLTRARNLLVIADDHSIFSGGARKGGGVKYPSLGDFLKVSPGQPNAVSWINLSATFTRGETLSQNPMLEKESLPLTSQDIGKVDFSVYRERLSQYPKRATPSSLKEDVDDSDVVPSRVSSSLGRQTGLDYGNWWHQLMEQMPWSSLSEARQCAEMAVNSCPVPERGLSELKQFFESEWVQSIFGRNAVVLCEVPIFHAADPSLFMEGFIDCFIFFPDEKEYWVVDWKTDQVSGKEPGFLVELYRSQLLAYEAFVSAQTDFSVKTYLYSTFLGSELQVSREVVLS